MKNNPPIAMVDPLTSRLALAPFDAEPFTADDRRSVAEADTWSKHNVAVQLEDVLAEFGLTRADWEAMAKTPLG